jgi:hypothetical protein
MTGCLLVGARALRVLFACAVLTLAAGSVDAPTARADVAAFVVFGRVRLAGDGQPAVSPRLAPSMRVGANAVPRVRAREPRATGLRRDPSRCVFLLNCAWLS